jgi:hypothetical protein
MIAASMSGFDQYVLRLRGNHSVTSLLSAMTHMEGDSVNKLAITLAVGASALFATAASAAPLSNGLTISPDSNVEQVRMVCNENGRCWRERSERRVIVQDSYGYAPRERYIERRQYGDDGGVRIRAPGVSVGIGTDRY